MIRPRRRAARASDEDATGRALRIVPLSGPASGGDAGAETIRPRGNSRAERAPDSVEAPRAPAGGTPRPGSAPRRPEGAEIPGRDGPRDGKRDGKRKAGGKPLTAARIRNICEHYVAQRECSREMLRSVLERRLARRVHGFDADAAHAERAAAEPLFEVEIARLAGAGLLDDARFAEARARSGLASGRGARRILTDLACKGISTEGAREALAAASREITGRLDREDAPVDIVKDAEWKAAEIFARKRRIGPHRRGPMPEDRSARARTRRREAAAMSRAGFDLDLVRRILDIDPGDG